MKLSAVAFTFAALAMGCSSKTEPSSSTLYPASLPAKTEIRPRTVEQAESLGCTVEGFSCAIGFPCGQFVSEQANCVCSGGKFTCYSIKGDVIGADPSASCTARSNGHDSECPAASPGTTGATCKTPGLACNYKGPTCPKADDISATETCICMGSDAPAGGAGPLKFRCEPGYCY